MTLAVLLENNTNKVKAYKHLSKDTKSPISRCVFTSDKRDFLLEPLKVGVFDTTEILNFSGGIVVDNIENAHYVLNNCPNCKIYFLCDDDNYKEDLFSFIRLIQESNVHLVLHKTSVKRGPGDTIKLEKLIPKKTNSNSIMYFEGVKLENLLDLIEMGLENEAKRS